MFMIIQNTHKNLFIPKFLTFTKPKRELKKQEGGSHISIHTKHKLAP